MLEQHVPLEGVGWRLAGEVAIRGSPMLVHTEACIPKKLFTCALMDLQMSPFWLQSLGSEDMQIPAYPFSPPAHTLSPIDHERLSYGLP